MLNGEFKLYIRPLDMFLSKVDSVKYPVVEQQYRMELIGVQVNMYKIVDFEYRDYYTPHVIEVEPWYKVENIKSGETKWIDKYTFSEFKRLNLIQ